MVTNGSTVSMKIVAMGMWNWKMRVRVRKLDKWEGLLVDIAENPIIPVRHISV